MTTPLPCPMPAAPRRRALILLLSMLTFSACVLRTALPPSDTVVLSTARGAQLHGTLVELATQRTLAFEAFVKAVAQAQVVAVGEEHYHPGIQAFELRLLQALVQHRPQRVALAMEFLERDIQPAVDTILQQIQDADRVRRGNVMARVRMIYLYDLAKKHTALVLGTENKTEYFLGYFTRYGDEAADIEPIRSLYKTQVQQLGQYFQLPASILNKAPSAGLWSNQTDEQEFGFSRVTDRLCLAGFFERFESEISRLPNFREYFFQALVSPGSKFGLRLRSGHREHPPPPPGQQCGRPSLAARARNALLGSGAAKEATWRRGSSTRRSSSRG